MSFPFNVHSKYFEEACEILVNAGEEAGLNAPQALEIPEDCCEARRQECRRITRLMQESSQFSFLRMGDMELTLLLGWQEGYAPAPSVRGSTDKGLADGHKEGSPGLGFAHSERLLNAFESASYVDFHEVLQLNRALLPRLRLCRVEGSTRNPDKWTSYILPLWVAEQFRDFCEQPGRRCGIAAAEASLLQWLSVKPSFLNAAKSIWPSSGIAAFHQLRDNGRNIDLLLDVVKEDLRRFIEAERLDTLFLSMGGGAKILCQELAVECRVRAIDFGAMTRALCDLGSDGNLAGRSSHSIYLYRLPPQLVVEGLLATRPDLSPADRMAKVHAQLMHQLLPDRTAYSRGNRMLDLSIESKRRFRLALRECCRGAPWLLRAVNRETRDILAAFDHFCGVHRLTARGMIFLGRFYLKCMVRRLISIWIRRS